MPSRRHTAWLAGALRAGVLALWLTLLLAQVAVLTHDTATKHADDSLCHLCIAGHSVGSAATAQVAVVLPPNPSVSPLAVSVDRPASLLSAYWQARAPPVLL